MKKNKLPNMVIMMILTLITSVFWVGTSVYRSIVTPKPVEIADEIIKQINPRLDTSTIGIIQSRQKP